MNPNFIKFLREREKKKKAEAFKERLVKQKIRKPPEEEEGGEEFEYAPQKPDLIDMIIERMSNK